MIKAISINKMIIIMSMLENSSIYFHAKKTELYYKLFQHIFIVYRYNNDRIYIYISISIFIYTSEAQSMGVEREQVLNTCTRIENIQMHERILLLFCG